MRTYDSVALNTLQISPLFLRGSQIELTDRKSDFADGVVFGEPVVVVDGQHQRLAHHFAVRYLEAERLVEERVQGLSVNAGLLLSLLIGH